MRNAWFGWVVFCALFATLGCRAPSPDWNGTWKVNPVRSSYQGQVFTISISADGEYHFDGNSSHTLRCDGQDRPIGNNRTQVCVKSGDTVLDITQRQICSMPYSNPPRLARRCSYSTLRLVSM